MGALRLARANFNICKRLPQPCCLPHLYVWGGEGGAGHHGGDGVEGAARWGGSLALLLLLAFWGHRKGGRVCVQTYDRFVG